MGGGVSLIDGHIDDEKRKTNFQNIKSMNENKLAKFLAELNGGGSVRYERFLQWLESEVDE